MPIKTAEIQFSLQELRHPGSDRPSKKGVQEFSTSHGKKQFKYTASNRLQSYGQPFSKVPLYSRPAQHFTRSMMWATLAKFHLHTDNMKFNIQNE